jgi:hypothetical protein
VNTGEIGDDSGDGDESVMKSATVENSEAGEMLLKSCFL